MELLKVSDFFEKEIPPFLLGCFFSRRIFSENNKYISIYTSYRKSMVIDTKEYEYETYDEDYITSLNYFSSPYDFWVSIKEAKDELDDKFDNLQGQACFVLENDINISNDSFYNKLYAKIISTCDWVFDEQLNEEKKSFIRGFMEPRGSVDTTANYFSIDYFYATGFEIKKARLLVDYMSIPYNVVNINFRELQHDYYSGIRQRNTQFRLNILWYAENIGFINGYKAELFAISRRLELPKPVNNLFLFNCDYSRRRLMNNLLDERLNFYSTNVFDKEITESDITKMRNDLGFDNQTTSIRNKALVEAIRYLTPDECACCKHIYNIEDRSYINKNTGRYYFEIHHVISIGNNKELDDENNMVKLCPTCHRELKRGSGTPERQKELIRLIFKNEPHTYEFAQHFYDSDDFEYIVERTFRDLN